MEGNEINGNKLKLAEGSPGKLGAVLTSEGVNFAVFSKYASEVYLLLFDSTDEGPVETVRIENRTGDVWHVFVYGLQAGQLYGYKVNGDYDPANGKRFNVNKLLIDPYAKALSGKFVNEGNSIFGYDLSSENKDLVINNYENFSKAPKCIVIDDSFDWQGDTNPKIPMSELVIYETHVKGFTAHSSSGVKHPGTYTGLIEKIPYFKDLGINALELMPVQEFYVRNELVDKGLSDFWGYNTIAFFAPEISYSTGSVSGCQVNEFKTLVREMHKAGLEVILDVVYNHTGEGNENGPTLCFKGIDNPSYYSLVRNPDKEDEPYRFYLNDTGCGNTLNIENPAVMRLVLDSLRYWVEEMHVDGFRFDLASILARVKGKFSENSLFFKAVSDDPVLNRVKMIAEPWDLTTYEVGNFPKGWSEWNGKFRDAARRFVKGDDGQAAEMATRLTGSADLYQDDGRKPHNSVNFVTCHDGFTLYDLFSYNEKHNEANLEDNRDGTDQNFSWNCGIEGETEDEKIIKLRKQMIKNAFCCLLFSAGTPMILYGDEVMRTQKGNNNVYCQDNELSWMNWDHVDEKSEMLNFVKKALAFRRTYPILRARRFFKGKDKKEGSIPDLAWFGKHLDEANWTSPRIKTLSYQLAGDPELSVAGTYYLFMVFNMNHRGCRIELPGHEGLRWYRLVDTSRRAGKDFLGEKKEKLLRKQEAQYFRARSVSVFLGEKR